MFASKQDELMPKKKFAFTTRKKERDATGDLNIHGEDKHNVLSGTPLSISSASMQCGFSNKQDEKLSMLVDSCIYNCICTHACMLCWI